MDSDNNNDNDVGTSASASAMMKKALVKMDKAPLSKHRYVEEEEETKEEEYEEEEEEEEEEETEEEYEDEEEEETAEEYEDEEDEEEENERAGTFKTKAPCSKAGYKRAVACKVRDLPDQYGADIYQSGHATRPTNPYFVAKIRAERRDQLYIPVNVVKEYNLQLPSSMTIRDSAGREFETKLKKWKDGRIWLIGGWLSLCRWNLAEKDVNCICEFVKGKGKKGLYLQVQILHEGSVSYPNKKNVEEEEEDEEEEEEEEKENERAGIFKKKASRLKAGCEKATGCKVRDPVNQYGADIFKSGRATQPKNPYFVTKIRAKRRDQLYIPIDVVRDYKLELPSRMTIRDSVGREFEARVKNWNDGRKWLIGGWRNLCKWNLVDKDDKCICEFVKGKHNEGLYLQVQVIYEGSSSHPNKK